MISLVPALSEPLDISLALPSRLPVGPSGVPGSQAEEEGSEEELQKAWEGGRRQKPGAAWASWQRPPACAW